MNERLSVVFCEDIRREDNGKLLLIGTYSEDLVPGILPQTLTMAFWARLRGLSHKTYSFEVSIGVNEIPQEQIPGQVEVLDGQDHAHIYLTGIPIRIEAPGRIFFSVKGFTDNKILVDTLTVREPRALQNGVP